MAKILQNMVVFLPFASTPLICQIFSFLLLRCLFRFPYHILNIFRKPICTVRSNFGEHRSATYFSVRLTTQGTIKCIFNS